MHCPHNIHFFKYFLFFMNQIKMFLFMFSLSFISYWTLFLERCSGSLIICVCNVRRFECIFGIIYHNFVPNFLLRSPCYFCPSFVYLFLLFKKKNLFISHFFIFLYYLYYKVCHFFYFIFNFFITIFFIFRDFQF